MHLAKRYFMLLIGICLWPLAWAICDLVTKFLIDLAVNPSNNAGLGIPNVVGTLAGPLAGLAYLIVIAIWVIGSTVLAPVFIGVLLAIGGGTATAAIFGATLGAAVTRSVQTALATAGGVGGMAGVIGGIGSNGSAPISAQSASRMSAYQNYASRPIAPKEEPKA
jgi:F420-0:gamma-glutamyl ligase-like protein